MAGHPGTDDHGPAGLARLPLPSEHLRMIQVSRPAAEVVDVPGEAGPAGLDRVVQDGSDRGVQAACLGQAQAAGPPRGVDPRVMQGLIGVDVADAGDDSLVEQHGLDGARASRVRLSRRAATVKAAPSGSDPSRRRNGSLAQGAGPARRIQPNRLASL
jgi:hypothetical protein